MSEVFCENTSPRAFPLLTAASLPSCDTRQALSRSHTLTLTLSHTLSSLSLAQAR